MWKKLLCILALSTVTAVFGSDYNEFESNPFSGIHRGFGPQNKLTAVTEADGNQCLKFEIASFRTTENGKRMIHGSLHLGRFNTKPGEIFHYSVSVKGTIPFVFLSALEWIGKDFDKDLKFTKDLKYRRIPVSADWKEYTGTFTAGEKAQKITLALMLYEDERYTEKLEYSLGDYVLLDKVRITVTNGTNLFTHLSFLPPPQEKFVKKPGDYVILCKGNSITRHSANDWTREKLGWNHVAGMAASKEENDYAHRLASMIQEVMPGKNVRLLFGRGNKTVLSDIANERAYRPDLIILQGGEHAVTPKELPSFEKFMRDTLKCLKEFPGKPQVITVGVWETSPYTEGSLMQKVQKIQSSVSKEFDIPFVSVEKFANDPACRGWGTSSGVRWHPNDLGMEKYAEAIFTVWESENKKKGCLQ